MAFGIFINIYFFEDDAKLHIPNISQKQAFKQIV